MRRHYAAHTGRLLRVYGLRPWDLPRLTGRELSSVLTDLAQVIRLEEGNDGQVGNAADQDRR